MRDHTEASLRRWRAARSIVLGTILVSGIAAAAVMALSPRRSCPHEGAVVDAEGYSYGGIGVELEQRGEHFVVRRVFKGAPADGVVEPGAVLVTANGERPSTMEGWTGLIRGEPGTSVELEFAYHCGGHEKVVLTRGAIRVRR